MKNYPINDIEDENYCPEILIHPERLEKLEAKLADKDRQLAEARAALETAESEIRGAIKLCGEYAISAKEGLHASLALSIGRLKYQLECELAHKKKLSDCANSGIIANESLLGQLAEARADAEHWKSECNALQRMVHEARAEIERLHMALEALYSWVKAEADHFGANAPDDDMIVMVSSAIKAAKGEV